MALVDSVVVRFIWLDGYNIFISALELFFIFNVVFFLTCNPQRVLCDCVGWGMHYHFSPFGFFGFRIRQRTPFYIIQFDLKVPVVSVGGRLALASGGAAPSLIPRSGLWWVCPHLCWDTVLVYQVFPSFICFN